MEENWAAAAERAEQPLVNGLGESGAYWARSHRREWPMRFGLA